MLIETLNKFISKLEAENSAYPQDDSTILEKKKKEGVIVKLTLAYTDNSKKYIHKFGCIRALDHFCDKQMKKVSEENGISTYEGELKMFDGTNRKIVLKKHMKYQKLLISISK